MNPTFVSGVVLLGADIRKGPLLPVPVLLLSGDQDGVLRLSRVAQLFK